MHVAALHTYPVKGCQRVDQASAYVLPWGLLGDRRWLIVDEDGVAVTQRENVALTRVFPRTVDGGLRLRAAGREELSVEEPVVGERVAVSVFSFTGTATGAGAAADAWLSEVLSQKVRLVWQDDTGQRGVPPKYAQSGDSVVFQDEFPVTLANLASLDALNDLIAESGSLEGPLPMTRFRPNIELAGATAWLEDSWNGGRVRIGEVEFRVPKGCGRCVVTTTDQDTGERGHEPLRALGVHRNVNQKLLFATNLIPEGMGTIRVGDPVEAV
jgi:uncharacterized protein YcbX